VVTKITILNILFPKIYFIAAEISNSPRCQSKLLLRKHRTDCWRYLYFVYYLLFILIW